MKIELRKTIYCVSQIFFGFFTCKLRSLFDQEIGKFEVRYSRNVETEILPLQSVIYFPFVFKSLVLKCLKQILEDLNKLASLR